MRLGRNLADLSAEIIRQAGAKQDYIVPTARMEMQDVQGPDAGEHRLELAFGDQHLAIKDLAHQQIGEHVKIPAAYYRRMETEAPDLLVTNVNRWFAKYPAKRTIRVLDGHARAFLSDRYRPMENDQLAEAVMPVLGDLGVEILSCDVTDRKFYIKAVDQRILRDVPSGRKIGDGSHVFFDTLSPAITISNSEVGLGRMLVETSIFTRVCTNMATMSAAGSVRRHHVGGKHEILGDEVYAMLSDETRRLDDAALWSKVRDVVRAAFDQARFQTIVDTQILGMADQPIDGDVIELVNLSGKRFGFNDDERKSVLDHLIRGGDLTRYGFFNAVTRTAEDLADYDRATDFEHIGGQIIEMPAADWKELAAAA